MINQVFKTTILVALIGISSFNSFGQHWRTNGNNTGFPTPVNDRINANSFVGSTGNVPFQLRTTQNQPIIFQTNGANERMRILGNNGFVGLNMATPQSRLHLNEGGTNAIWQQLTNGATGTAATDGFRLGISAIGEAEIRQQEVLSMNFFTANIQRATVLGNNGFVGIGTNFTTPVSLLHVNANNSATGEVFRTNGPIANINAWRMVTGATEKFSVFTTLNTAAANGTTVNDSNITLQASQRDMIFNAGGNIERMRILGRNHDLTATSPWFATARAGNVGIGTAHPLTMLHMGGEGAAGAGYRAWMNIGTYYASRGGFDNMYVGLRQVANDRNEAIISWGNNPSNANNGDRLRYLFTAAPNNGLASGANGLEIGRMWSNGNVGRTGFGNFAATGIDPARRLEVLDDAENLPQLRLTQTQNTAFTDFQATAAGNLRVNPSNQRTGFNLAAGAEPNNTVEINQGTANNSGLRFTQLTSAFVPTVNTQTALTVDANGDVILANVATTGGTLFCTNAQENFHTKFIDQTTGELCNSIAFDDGTNMGVSTTTPDRKLDVFDNGMAGSGPFSFYVGRPQLRLTQADNTVFTDLQTHRTGDLLINPRTGTTQRFVGINLAGNPFAADDLPTRTLDVNGNGRFRTLPQAVNNTLTNVVVTDADGNLFIKNDFTTGGGGAGDHDWYEVGTNPGTAPDDINDQQYTFNNVGIGTATPYARLHVEDTENWVAVYGITNSATSSDGEFPAGWFESHSTSNSATAFNIGVKGFAKNGGTNVGVFGKAEAGLNTSYYAGYFDGPTYIGGTVYGSDEKLKKNIINMDSALIKIKQLNPREFNFRTSEYPTMTLCDKKQYGLIAQEVEPIFPELISDNTHPAKYDSSGNKIADAFQFKGLNYNGFITILLKGVQEQQAQIDSIQVINDTYLSQLDSIKNAHQTQLDSIWSFLNSLPPGFGNGNTRTGGSDADAEVIPLPPSKGEMRRPPIKKMWS